MIRSVGAAPVDYSPLTCEPGTWSGSPSFTYTFQVEDASLQVLQSGPSNVYAPPSNLIDLPLVCIVQAEQPRRRDHLPQRHEPPIGADTAPPVRLGRRGPRCHLHACTFSIAASDPNSVALGVQARARYTVTTRCPPRRGKGRPGASRRSGCQPDGHRAHAPQQHLPGAYRATAKGCRIASASRSRRSSPTRRACARCRPLIRSATLHPPSRTHGTARRPSAPSTSAGRRGGRSPLRLAPGPRVRTIAFAPVSAPDPISPAPDRLLRGRSRPRSTACCCSTPAALTRA